MSFPWRRTKREESAHRSEAEVGDERRESLKPGARRLLEPIQGLVQQAHGVGLLVVDEPDGLLAEYMFLQVAMKKDIGHVLPPSRPAVGRDEGEDDADGSRFDDGRERLVEIDAGLLCEAPDHPSGLVALQGTVGV